MPVKSYRDLNVWKAAVELVICVYRRTEKFPKHEVFGLAGQIQRSAVSIPSNVAEGHARASDKEFHHFLSISLGSLAELETQLIIAEKLDYIKSESMNELLAKSDELGKMLKSLQKRVKGSS
jgi:four helix bundle protein